MTGDLQVVDLSSFPDVDPGLLKPDAQFLQVHGAGTEKWAMLVHKPDASNGAPSLPVRTTSCPVALLS